MKRLLIVLAFLSCAPAMWATSLSTVATGGTIDWKNASSWSPAQVPTNADTCTIINSTTKIQVTDAETCGHIHQQGTGSSISESVEIVSGGVLTLDGTNGQDGNWVPDLSTGLLIHGGQVVFKVAASTASTLTYNNVSPGTSIQQLDICDDATCTSTSATSAWPTAITTSYSGTSSFAFKFGNGYSPTLTMHHVIINGIGAPATTAWDLCGNVAGHAGNITYSGVLVTNAGSFKALDCTSTVSVVVHVDGLGFVNSIDTTGGAHKGMILTAVTAPQAGSYFRNMFGVMPPTITQNSGFTFTVIGAQVGSYAGAPGDTTDNFGYFGYNVPIFTNSVANGVGTSIRNSVVITDAEPGSVTQTSIGFVDNDGESLYYDGVFCNFFHCHHISTAGAGSGAATTIDHVLADSNYVNWLNAGRINFSAGTVNFTNDILIGNVGSVAGGSGSADVISWINGTVYNGGYFDINHTSGANGTTTTLNSIHNQITAWPSQIPANSFAVGWMYALDSGFARQGLAGGVNQNLFYGMTGGTDPGAVSGSGLFLTQSNDTLGTTSSYVAPTQSATALANATILSGGTPGPGQVVTTAGNFGTIVRGDFFVNGATKSWDVISAFSGTPATSITLLHGCGAGGACATTVSGGSTAWSTYPGWSSAGLIYGVDSPFGTGDFSFDPSFRDPSRNFCQYAKQVLGLSGVGTVGCLPTAAMGLTPNAGTSATANFNITGSSGSTDLKCSGCTFQTWGTRTGSTGDTVIVYNAAGSTARCVSNITTVVSETELTLTSTCTGIGNTDTGFFITPSLNLANYIFGAFGWSIGGSASGGYTIGTTAANGWTFRPLYQWVAWGLTPMNGRAKGAGTSGADLGAAPVYPAAINSN